MNIYRIKASLRYIEPPIWRRIEVPSDITLAKLHAVLQAAMGWRNVHLHAFRIGREIYGKPDRSMPDYAMNDERKTCLDAIAGQGDTIIYEYDFGDGWEHTLKIEKVFPPEPKVRYPRCTAGRRACPPEDCGGPPGYAHLLDVLRDPRHEEHEELRDWLPSGFDPEAFDADAINKRLGRMK